MSASEVQSPVLQSRLVYWLFAAGLVAIPFDAVRGVGALGELGNELSFPFFAAAIAAGLIVAVRSGDSRLTSSVVLRIGVAMLAVIALSYVVNVAEIHGIVFRERTGGNKFATSLLVILYGLALAWLAEQVEQEHLTNLVARFVCWSVAVSIFYIFVEAAGRSGMLGGLYDAIDGIVHTRQADVINAWDGSVNQKVVYGWDERYRSVSFEPPAFGNYCGLAWPWVWYAAVKAAPERRLRSWGLLALFTIVVVVAASRTGLLILAANLLVLLVLSALYARPGAKGEAAAAARLLMPAAVIALGLVGAVYFISDYQSVVARVVGGESVSDLSRLAFQTAAAEMFAAHPLLGVGLGQFGFHVTQYLPDWAYRSPEILPMVTYPLAPWPNVYSIYARLAAELGLVGLLGWCALWLALAAKLAARARHHRTLDQQRVSFHYPIIMNCFGVLVSGITTDTYRTPMLWIALGLSCGVLLRARSVEGVRVSGGSPALEQ